MAVLALAAWAGGLAALGGIAAPSIFAALQMHDPAGGRTLAAVTFGEVLARFDPISIGLGLLVLVSLGARAALGPRPRHWKIRIWTTTAMLAATVVTGHFLAPRIASLRDALGTTVASLPESDPRRVTFGRLHGASNVLMLFTVVAGIGLLWAEVRDNP